MAKSDIKQILFSRKTIENRIKWLARKLTKDYKGKNPILICILKGSFVFLSELLKNMPIPLTIDFVQVGSYGKRKIPGKLKFKKDIDCKISGRHVLIIEDIIDTGKTLKFIIKTLKKRGPKSVKICSLLDKPSRRKVKVPLDYLGFTVPNKFIVGYGIDYNEKYRNLPYIATVD